MLRDLLLFNNTNYNCAFCYYPPDVDKETGMGIFPKWCTMYVNCMYDGDMDADCDGPESAYCCKIQAALDQVVKTRTRLFQLSKRKLASIHWKLIG